MEKSEKLPDDILDCIRKLSNILTVCNKTTDEEDALIIFPILDFAFPLPEDQAFMGSAMDGDAETFVIITNDFFWITRFNLKTKKTVFGGKIMIKELGYKIKPVN